MQVVEHAPLTVAGLPIKQSCWPRLSAGSVNLVWAAPSLVFGSTLVDCGLAKTCLVPGFCSHLLKVSKRAHIIDSYQLDARIKFSSTKFGKINNQIIL